MGSHSGPIVDAWVQKSRPKESHTHHAGGQPQSEPPAEHVDRAWPDTGPTHNHQAAAKRAVFEGSIATVGVGV